MAEKITYANTGVFWDVDEEVECPISEGLDPDPKYKNIESTLASEGFLGDLSIRAYVGKDTIREDDSLYAGITVVATEGEKRYKKMLYDIFYWALENRVAPFVKGGRRPNVIVVTRNMSANQGFACFADALKTLRTRNYNIVFVLPSEVAYSSPEWTWARVVCVGEPFFQGRNYQYPSTGGSRLVCIGQPFFPGGNYHKETSGTRARDVCVGEHFFQGGNYQYHSTSEAKVVCVGEPLFQGGNYQYPSTSEARVVCVGEPFFQGGNYQPLFPVDQSGFWRSS